MNLKNIFKNKNTMSTENTDKEILDNEKATAENHTDESAIGVETAEELSVEQKLEEDLAKEKDKFLRLFAEFENYKNVPLKSESNCLELPTKKCYKPCCQFWMILTEPWFKFLNQKMKCY